MKLLYMPVVCKDYLDITNQFRWLIIFFNCWYYPKPFIKNNNTFYTYVNKNY